MTLGYATVGAANRLYPEMFEHEIREPFGMHDTVLDIEQFLPERVAVGYRRDGKPLAFRGVGFNSTAPDMLRFVEANLFRPRAMPPLSVRAMSLAHQPRFQISATRSIGMIWYTDQVGDGVHIVQKAGGNGGFVAWIGLLPEKAAAVVLLCNGHPVKGGPSIIQTGEEILCRATGLPIPLASIKHPIEHPDGGIQEDDADA